MRAAVLADPDITNKDLAEIARKADYDTGVEEARAEEDKARKAGEMEVDDAVNPADMDMAAAKSSASSAHGSQAVKEQQGRLYTEKLSSSSDLVLAMQQASGVCPYTGVLVERPSCDAIFNGAGHHVSNIVATMYNVNAWKGRKYHAYSEECMSLYVRAGQAQAAVDRLTECGNPSPTYIIIRDPLCRISGVHQSCPDSHIGRAAHSAWRSDQNLPVSPET
ncbi:hypothetical protein P389DRAFT_193086 [Cystobasidium minutum MCA 4210]|uniref:uncharacterized protein n=1 Tax=Cystobasidium minutum MCA 4210 TaxID=1397322 RepID=UPI0034CFCCA4|eukprot:jgi/Rhomi1/193086/gm1.1300_g